MRSYECRIGRAEAKGEDDAMAKIMIASQQMTDGQIENVVAKLRDALRKHRGELGSEPVQQVLGVENLGMELLAPFRKRVEAMTNIIVRHVTVNRAQTPQAMLDATGRRQYTDRKVVDAMPRSEGEEVDVYLFKPRPEAYKNGFINDDDLEKEYEFHGLVPADPYSLAAVIEADPAFADKHRNVTHWKDANGKWCYIAFSRWDGERSVGVNRDGRVWFSEWWFAGLRK